MKIKDPVKVIGLFLPIPVLFFIAGMKWWGWFFTGVGALLAFAEGMSYLFRGISISEQFWAWQDKPMKYMIVTLWMVFAIYLACHLLWRA